MLTYFPRQFSRKAIYTYFAALAGCYAIFPNKLPFIWIVFGSFEVITFFYFLNRISSRWARIKELSFQKKLFWTALLIRSCYIFFAYFFYQAMTGTRFEFEAADSLGYNTEAIWIKGLFLDGKISQYFIQFRQRISDTGYPLLLGAVYAITDNSILVARLLNALMSAQMCVLLYRLSFRNFGEQAARMTAIMAMLLPTFVFYTGLHVKETTMVFLLVLFIERADLLIRSPNRNIVLLIQILLLGLLLFFFRTVLAVAAWFALFTALLFISNKIISLNKRLTIIIWLSLAALFTLQGRIMTEVTGYAKERFINQRQKLEAMSKREAGNTLAIYGSALVFFPMMPAAPFPTMVNIPTQRNTMMINGNVFTRNVYAFFLIVGLWIMFRRKILRQHVLILTFVAGYIFILANSGFALADRFHLPLVPFLLILAGYGITQIERKHSRYYVPYLILIVIVIIGWNWFKLAGRGIV